MPIRVRFDKHGFYHPAFGRLGRGKNQNKIYVLPDQFGEEETIKVSVMDSTSKPPRKIDEKEITRYKHLPATAEVIDDEHMAELIEEANAANEEPPKPERPKVADGDELEKVTGKGRIAKAQSAVERTTGKPKAPARSRSRQAAPEKG